MSAREDLLSALDQGRLSDAHAYLALKPLWRDGRITRPGGRSRQHILLAKETLRTAARSGLLTEEEAEHAMRPLRPDGEGAGGAAG
ncbi:hypothetical protein O4J56_14100 [Nocardiopsis sp. RSe5-2]|uniref:DUF222 domain-containing protein n=1 Tax=Nocardiopsis endophytica TaxID=3018445 RepID=A0ABT4U4A2_9ACTN|nr:hypothetical protein [Nocardiopsis endophytica]MDA2811770.1 hypothetical protein [Nocardiopsis endophytica]